MPGITNHQGNKNQSHNEIPFHSLEWLFKKKNTKT